MQPWRGMRGSHELTHLGGEDAAWLHMEDETNPMVVNGLLELGGPIDVPRLTAALDRHLASRPRFRALVGEPALHVGTPRWEPDPDFDVARHLERVTLDPGDDSLRAFVGQRVSRLLERDRPLWRVYVIDRGRAGTAVLCRIHHSIADGFALLDLLLRLCGEPERARAHPETHGWTTGGVIRQFGSLTRLLTLPHDPQTLLKAPLTREKRVGWSRPIALERVKAIARGLSATVNDVLVAVVAGALRARLVAHGDDVPEVRAMVPVNLRNSTATTEALGNHFGVVILGLPVGVADPVERVAETRRRMGQLKSSPEAIVAQGVIRAMGWAPVGLEDLGVAFFGKKASLVLTNVPGPREPLHLAGAPVRRVVFWVPQSARMGLGISIFSYARAVTLGVFSDASVIAEPQELADALEHELDLLGERASARATAATT